MKTLLASAETSPPSGATWPELMLLGVAVLLTLGVAGFMLTYFITQQRREGRSRRDR
ncbi:MAG: hypothetical protein QF561_04200 [Phycisphaerales bacterium]|jgi:hypothetical protein|nr:hypothetical protein [Phycisphaerales bacterium]